MQCPEKKNVAKARETRKGQRGHQLKRSATIVEAVRMVQKNVRSSRQSIRGVNGKAISRKRAKRQQSSSQVQTMLNRHSELLWFITVDGLHGTNHFKLQFASRALATPIWKLTPDWQSQSWHFQIASGTATIKASTYINSSENGCSAPHQARRTSICVGPTRDPKKFPQCLIDGIDFLMLLGRDWMEELSLPWKDKEWQMCCRNSELSLLTALESWLVWKCGLPSSKVAKCPVR